MAKNQKPLRELKRDTRRVVNDALVSLRDLGEELLWEKRVPFHLRNIIWQVVHDLESSKKLGVDWWKKA